VSGLRANDYELPSRQLIAVTGLLLSYRFSSAVQKWDEGKSVWVGVRGTIRDGVRMVRYVVPFAHLRPQD